MGSQPHLFAGQILSGSKTHQTRLRGILRHPLSGGGLKWMEGTVPTPYGNIHIYMDKKVIRIKSDGGKGILNIPTRKGMKAMTIETRKEQVFKY